MDSNPLISGKIFSLYLANCYCQLVSYAVCASVQFSSQPVSHVSPDCEPIQVS
uniref:Uncharacterized protein n=1 Tax=Anguilla anguilla TaxID=7936 RepID=A0A0E9TCD6_ANGAN